MNREIVEDRERKPLNVIGTLESIGGWYTIEGGAKQLGLTRAAVYEGLRRYSVPVKQIGQVILFRPEVYRDIRQGYVAQSNARKGENFYRGKGAQRARARAGYRPGARA